MIEVREMRYEDVKEACVAEYNSLNGAVQYLEDAFHYYQSAKGELSVALIDGKIVGIGKMSVLFDGSAWLEILRVDPSYQKMGVGQAIYNRYFEGINYYRCPHVALYTGLKNEGSMKLAQRHHMSINQLYKSYSSTLLKQYNVLPFHILKSLPEDDFNIKHLCINHTFYRNNKENLKGFLSQGYIYQYKDTYLVMGSRFQPFKALYIAYIQGSYYKEALEYALNIAYLKGIDKVIYHFENEVEVNQELLDHYGFNRDQGEDVVMSGDL